jgi:hypothetical protein
MNDQIRKIRDEVSKEFDEKYKASLEDIDRYKASLEKYMKENEQRTQAMVARQLSDKDKIIQ